MEMIPNHTPNSLRPLPWPKSPPPLLVEVQPDALQVELGPLRRFDVGVDPSNVENAGISPMQGPGNVETYYCLWQAVGNDLVFEVEVIDPEDEQGDV